MDSIDNKGEIVLYQPDETIRLEVRMGEETVWLTQQQMAELFGTGRQAITKHLQNIYECAELKKEATSSVLELVRQEGNRKVRRKIEFYNLDVIISVGYRVNTKRGIEFRQWANRVLKEYLLRGYAVNTRIAALEQHAAKQDVEITELKSKIDFFVRTSLPPVEGIFFDGQIFDAYAQIVGLIRQAKKSIVLVDNYIDETTLTMLSRRDANVSATIYTRPLTAQQQLDIQRHNQQYHPIVVNICQRNHDRFLIIDDAVYIFGASLKDAGKRLFAYIKMQETNATDLISGIR
ncbi:MAG: virulence RhuM family protein [Bacteroidaceae bacterium]|nr:virulence RhuM family protein [Bacteroidaceae bacterium]